MRIAWFSEDKEPASTSRYSSEALLPFLLPRAEITQYSHYPESGDTRHFLSAFREHAKNPFDLFFYQVEDRTSSYFSRMHLGLIPGITLFHQFLFTTRGPIALASSDADYDDPYGLREGRSTIIPIFSDPWSQGEFRRVIPTRQFSHLLPSISSFYLPHPVRMPAEQPSLPKNVIGFVGEATLESRCHKVLQAISLVRPTPSLIWLTDNSKRAEELCREFRLRDVTVLSGVSPERWSEVVPNITVAIHTRFSVYGSLGPYLPISLSFGRPVIVSRFGTTDFWPESFTVKVTPGHREAKEIAAALEKLLPCDATNHFGREFVRENHDPETVANQLLSIFEYSATTIRAAMNDWKQTFEQSKEKLVERTLGFVPSFPLSQKHLRAAYRELGWVENE
jgi:glycosyltransferase involved in cell wall biosynthesis